MIFLIKKNKIKIYKFNLLNKSEIKIKEKLFSYIYSNTIGKANTKHNSKPSYGIVVVTRKKENGALPFLYGKNQIVLHMKKILKLYYIKYI